MMRTDTKQNSNHLPFFDILNMWYMTGFQFYSALKFLGKIAKLLMKQDNKRSAQWMWRTYFGS